MSHVVIEGRTGSNDSQVQVTSGALDVTPATLIAGERNPDSADSSYLMTHRGVNMTVVDASGGAVTNQAISAAAPAILYGVYVTAGAADTLVVSNGTTDVFTQTVGAGDSLTTGLPSGCGIIFDTSIVVDLSDVGVALVYWWPL